MREFREARRISILSAPSNLGLKPSASGVQPGVRELPPALLSRNLLELLLAENAGTVVPPCYDPTLDPLANVRNATRIMSYTIDLADRVGGLMDASRFALVLGGDCSILLGIALALKRRGRYGLLFVDGHTDLLTPATSTTGGVAGMDLAIATGTGPEELTSIEGLRPYIQKQDVALFGFRWPEPGRASPAQPSAPMSSYPLSMIRRGGVLAMAEQAVAHFAGREFWIHLDADVLDPRWMPAVDSPDPGGMSPDEVAWLLKLALAEPGCVGLDLTIYDPTLDQTGEGAALLVDLLENALGPLDKGRRIGTARG